MSTGFILIIAEIGMRAFFPVAAQLYTFDEERHYAFRPNSRKLHLRHEENGGGGHAIRINSQGFRGEELERPQRRLCVYGDSFVAGEYSSLDATFCEQLENRMGDTWEVVNAGITGYGLDQTLLKMEAELETLAPDALVVVVCSENDSIDLMRNKLFEVDESGKLQRTQAALSPSMQKQLIPRSTFHPRNLLLAKTVVRAARAIGTKSEPDPTPEVVCEDFLQRARDQFESFQVERDLEVTQVIEDFYDIDWSLNPNSEVSQFKTKVTREILRRMHANAKQRDLPLFVVIVPSIRDTVENDDIFAQGLRQQPGYEPSRLTKHYATLASELQIPHLNLYDPFVARGAKDLYFQAHDSHWNDEGQKVAADLVFQLLKKDTSTSPLIGQVSNH